MILSLDDCLAALEPCMPGVLVSPETFRRMRRIARLLPPMSAVGFEVHLGEGTPRADLLACLASGDGGRDVLASESPVIDFPVDAVCQDAWQRLRTLCKHWKDNSSALSRHVPNIWLEFDLDGSDRGAPTPGIFFGIDRTDTRQQVAAAALEIILGTVSPALKRGVAGCFAALPPAAHVPQIGLLLSRPFRGVRVCVAGLQPEQIPPYLMALRWPGAMSEVGSLLASVAPLADALCLDLDVDESVSPCVGIECYPGSRPPLGAAARWRPFLDDLVGRGLCTAAQRGALLTWPGCTPHEMIWQSLLFRDLHHLKLVCEPGRVRRVKAYFGAFRRWVQCGVAAGEGAS